MLDVTEFNVMLDIRSELRKINAALDILNTKIKGE